MLFLLIVTSAVNCVTFSKYLTVTSGAYTARVASFDYDLTTTDPVSGNTYDDFYFSIDKAVQLSDGSSDGFIVREVTVTNKSEVAVTAEIEIPDLDSSGIVWCVFPDGAENVLSGGINASIQDVIGGAPGEFSELQYSLLNYNDNTITDWNNNACLTIEGPGSTKTFTIVFWAEQEPEIDQSFDLTLTVTQID